MLALLLITSCTPNDKRSPFEKVINLNEETAVITDEYILPLKNESIPLEARYVYSTLPAKDTQQTTIKGKNIKIELLATSEQLPPYSTIYINRATNESYGICEPRKAVPCKTLGKITALDYIEHNPITPYDWLKKIQPPAKTIGTASINQQATTIIITKNNNKTITLWINDYYHLPIKVEITRQEGEETITEKTYFYNQLQTGNIKQKEVEPEQ